MPEIQIALIMRQPFFVPAVVIAVVSLPLIFALIPKNRIYGIRTRKTMSDDRVWYAVNRLGGGLMLVSSVVYLVFAGLFPASGPHDPRFGLWMLHLGAFAAPLLISIIAVSGYARRL